jgi:GNAT superfamily N-acetyltransferase
MKIITSDNIPISELAQIALDSELYHSPTWTIIHCYRDIIQDSDVAKTSELILLKSDLGKYIGAMYHNNEYSHRYWGTNIQAFIKEEHRLKGYGKMLYKELNKRLIEKGFEGSFEAGSGVIGSLNFWGKMNDLHTENADQYFELDTSNY